MTFAETERRPTPEVLPPIDTVLRGEELAIPAGSRLPDNDPLRGSLTALGVQGEPMAGLQMGRQSFAILDISTARPGHTKDSYLPFQDQEVVKRGTPHYFEMEEGSPYILAQLTDEGQIVGRAIRPGESIHLGREAKEKDPKSARFDYEHDEYLSRNHAHITFDPEKGIVVADDDSKNGTNVHHSPSAGEELQVILTPTNDAERQTLANEELPITKEVMIIPEMFPRQEIRIGSKTMYLSGVLKGSRPHAVLYSTIEKDGKQVTVPRMLYKSNSDGGWRVGYGISHGRYVKEAHAGQAHYTQETKLHPDILDALELAEPIDDTNLEITGKLLDIFTTDNPGAIEANTAESEISYYKDPSTDAKFAPARRISAGYLETEIADELKVAGFDSIGAYFESLDGMFDAMPGFVPDFTKLPTQTHAREHTMLGEILVDDYTGVYGNQAVVWSMARDKDGAVWIENIRLANNEVSSYGNFTEIFDAGLLTNKPLEYPDQADGLKEMTEKVPHKSGYVDITPVLARLKPIRQYKQALQARS